jgi:hypothetical protein
MLKALVWLGDAVDWREAAHGEGAERHRFCNRVVEGYTACALTKGSDKLVAIAGVARWMLERFGGEYLCGVLREEFDSQCMWGLVNVWKLGMRPSAEGYRSPSRSWVKIDGG